MKKFIEQYFKYILFIVFILVLIVFLLTYSNVDLGYVEVIDNNKELMINTDISEAVNEEKYYVDVKGEVLKPGVYEVNPNDRLIDVIKLCGGLTKNADISLLNLSKKVIDEMNIKIYSKKEVENAKNELNKTKEPEVIEIIKEIEKECICPDVNDACIEVEEERNIISENKSLLDINKASKEELMTLTGIGESKADKIVEYRKTTPFKTIEEVKNISGIGDSIFEKIKNDITV